MRLHTAQSNVRDIFRYSRLFAIRERSEISSVCLHERPLPVIRSETVAIARQFQQQLSQYRDDLQPRGYLEGQA